MGAGMILTLEGLVLIAVGFALGWGVILADPAELKISRGDGAARAAAVRKALAGILMGLGLFVLLGQVLYIEDEPDEPAVADLVWYQDFDQGLAEAKKTEKRMLVDVWATWCPKCIELSKVTFKDPEVAKRLAGYVLVKLDFSDLEDPKVVALGERLEIPTGQLPWVGFFEPDGALIPGSVLNSFEEPKDFIKRLEQPKKKPKKNRIVSWLEEKGLLLTFLLVFIGGVGASLTPCAYPAYMMILGFLTMGGQRSRGASLAISSIMVLGLALMYAGLGTAAALGGGAVGQVMSNPWVMGTLSVLFLVMGLMSLRVFRFAEFGGFRTWLMKFQKANYLWAFVFGLVLGIIVAPCVGPIIVGILTYIAKTQDVGLGAGLMLAFALGMGVLLFVLALSFDRVRSKLSGVGKVGEGFTYAFGVIFFAAALYYLSGILPYQDIFSLISGG